MLKSLFTFTLIIGSINMGASQEALIDIVKFASKEKANTLLTTEDSFTKSWSSFDIDARMHKPNSTKEELFEFIKTQTREWTEEEKTKILTILHFIDQQIKDQSFNLSFLKEIYFVKTTTNEEGGAGGYTRGSYIVLKNDVLKRSEEGLKNIVIHELFHVLSRNNPDFRKAMYELIGFNIMNDVPYPENIKDFRITNPDAPQVDSYIQLEVDGKEKNCMMILYSKEAYSKGDFFQYLNIGFLSLIGNEIKTVEYNGISPVIYSLQEVSNFYEQVGKNTQYIIHPEEISADNFVLALLNKKDVPDAELVENIQKLLRK